MARKRSKGEGSITKRPNGLWQARLSSWPAGDPGRLPYAGR